MYLKKIILLSINCCLLATSFAAEMPPALVEVIEVETREIHPVLDVTGNVISRQDARLATQVSGVVQSVAAVGTRVNVGDTIAQIDSFNYQINLKRAEAQLQRLRADLTFREQEVARFQSLSKNNNASKAQLQAEQARRNMLIHDIAEAEAAVEFARIELDRTRVTAPFAGHIVERFATKGEFLSISDAIVRLVDTDDKEVSLFAPLRVSSFIEAGQFLAVNNGNNQTTLEVRTIVPVGNLVSRMIELRLIAKETPWNVGTAVTIKVPHGDKTNGLVVPRDALVLRNNQVLLYRVDQQMMAEELPAKILSVVDEWVSVANDLNIGDKIIIRGAERLQPGQPVIIK